MKEDNFDTTDSDINGDIQSFDFTMTNPPPLPDTSDDENK